MKFLIAGFGSIGRRHFRNLLSLGENDILFYRTNRSTISDDEIKDFQIETSIVDALAHKPDVVIISNPTAYHLQVAIPATRAGCNLLIEKPVSHSMDGIDELVHIVEKKNVKVLVGYQFRYHPGLRKVKSLIDNGEIGSVISVKAHWGEYLPDWHPWEDYKQGYSARADMGGGVVLTLSHPLDYVRWLFGEVEEVFGVISQRGALDIEVEDTALIGLKFVNGTIGNIYLDYNQRPPSHRLEVIGSEGTIRWDNYDGVVWMYKTSGHLRGEWLSFSPPENFKRNDMFLTQMKHFLNVVRCVEDPICTLHDGVRALEIALAVFESSKTKRMVKVI